MFRRTRVLSASVALLAAGVLAAGCSSNSASPGGSGSNAPVTIKAVLPPNTGPITAADNAGLKQLTTQYESAHKNVTVQWLPNNTGSISAANAQVESQASGGAAPDVVWEQYGPVTSGALPPGLLQNIKPYLTKPNPYVPGNSSWLSLFTPETGAQPGPHEHGAEGDRRGPRQRAVDRGDELGIPALPGVRQRVAVLLRVRQPVAVVADQRGAAMGDPEPCRPE
jgi:hypothetical protein